MNERVDGILAGRFVLRGHVHGGLSGHVRPVTRGVTREHVVGHVRPEHERMRVTLFLCCLSVLLLCTAPS